MTFIAKVNDGGAFTAIVNGSPAFDVTIRGEGAFNATMAVIGPEGPQGPAGPSGLLTADAPLVYDSVLKNLSINLSDYATESWVSSQGFITSSALTPYLLSSTAATTYYPLTNPSGFITASALTGYATESWVTSQGYLTSASLAGYATEVWVESQGYLVSSDLSPYLTITSAASTYYPLTNPTGFITASALTPYLTSATAASTYYPLTNPSGYITSSALSPYLLSATAASTYQTIAGMSSYYLASNPAGYITSAALGGYATESWVQSQGYLTAPYNPFDQTLNTTNTVQFGQVVAGYYPSPNAQPVGSILSQYGLVLTEPNGLIQFPDGTLQTTAWTGFYNPFDQTLNTTDSPAFDTVTLNNGISFGAIGGLTQTQLTLSSGGTGMVITDGGITFPDGTTQTTAAVFYDQSLNMTDEVSFRKTTLSDGGAGTIVIDPYWIGTGITHTVGPFIAKLAGVGGLSHTDSNGTISISASTGITFPDGTVQTTAASGNAFDQDLNTTNVVQFAGLTIADVASPASSVIITPDGTITVNDDGDSLDGGLYLNGANVCISFNNTDYQYKAYPFSGAVATAIEGGLLNSNSPSATNAFATLGDVESSVNAYAASVLPVLPTANEKAALSNANLPSASNPYLTLTGTPSASETQSGIVELANRAEVLNPVATNRAISPARAVTLATRMNLKRTTVNLQGGLSTQLTGTGALFTQLAQYTNASPPNAGVAGFARGYTIMNTADPTHIASNGAYINFSKPEGFAIAVYLTNASTATGIRTMGIWGEVNSPTAGVVIGDPTNKRIMFSHTAGGNILLMVHDGTTLYTVDSGMTPPVSLRKYYIEITWDGTGYAEMYVKDALGAESTVSTNNAPTGAPQSLQYSSFLLQVSATGAQTISPNIVPSHPSFFFG